MTASDPALVVVAPGLRTTLQDVGRIGWQRLGIPVSGALDPVALTAANLLVGNPAGTAALEITLQGPTLRAEADGVRVAYAGGTAPLELIDAAAGVPPKRLPALTSVRLGRGQAIRIGPLAGSCIGYLAAEGGFAVAPFLGSASTYARGGFGGFAGRALQAGDRLGLNLAEAAARDELMVPALDLAVPDRCRVMLGPQDDHFTEAGIATLLDATWTVSAAADRMGLRLDGPAITHRGGFDIVTDGTAAGALQVPGNGRPIVLLADRQTTGGYPKIATVISADLPGLGRLAPGATLRFVQVDRAAALAARRAFVAMLDGLSSRLVATPADIATRLASVNLVSGFLDVAGPAHGGESL